MVNVPVTQSTAQPSLDAVNIDGRSLPLHSLSGSGVDRDCIDQIIEAPVMSQHEQEGQSSFERRQLVAHSEKQPVGTELRMALEVEVEGKTGNIRLKEGRRLA
jgi:hypothetical protein